MSRRCPRASSPGTGSSVPTSWARAGVITVTVGHESLCVTHTSDGGYGCVGNACPHQGGPLGEGSIEGGWLRCPWHGYDYSPKNGKPPPPFNDAPAAFRTEVRADGVFAALPVERPRQRTVSDVLVETMVAWGVTTCSAWWATPTWDSPTP